MNYLRVDFDFGDLADTSSVELLGSSLTAEFSFPMVIEGGGGQVTSAGVASVNGQAGVVILDFAAASHEHQPDQIYADAAFVSQVGDSLRIGIYLHNGTDNGRPIYESPRTGDYIWWDSNLQRWYLTSRADLNLFYLDGNSDDFPWETDALWSPISPQTGSIEVDQAFLSDVSDYSSTSGIDLKTAKSGDASSTELVLGNDTRLTNAREATAHTHAIADVDNLQLALDGKQAAGSYVTLVGGTVPASQLPSYVDDVIEIDGVLAPTGTGEAGKIYVTTTNTKVWRWSGSLWTEIAASPSSTDSVSEGSNNLYHTTARAAAAAPIQSVAGRTGAVTLAIADVNNLQSALDGKQASGSYAPSAHSHVPIEVGLGNVSNIAQVTGVTGTAPISSSGGTTPAISISAATTSAAGSMSAADKIKLDGVAAGAEVNVNADWTATTGDAQILNKPTIFPPSGGGWGPLVLNRFRGNTFADSGYASNGQNPFGMFPLSPTGNTLEGFGFDGTWPRIFNPAKLLGAGTSWAVTAYVRASGIFNDGFHCQIRSFNGITASIVSGLGDFGGGGGGPDRIYFATSDTFTALDVWYSFAVYLGAYSGGNGGVIQDTVLVFNIV